MKEKKNNKKERGKKKRRTDGQCYLRRTISPLSRFLLLLFLFFRSLSLLNIFECTLIRLRYILLHWIPKYIPSVVGRSQVWPNSVTNTITLDVLYGYMVRSKSNPSERESKESPCRENKRQSRMTGQTRWRLYT